MTPKFGVSHYNEDVINLFNTVRRGPRCGLIKDSKSCLGINVVRVYTHLIRTIETIPLFSKFDNLQWVGSRSVDIIDEAFYFVRVECDPILFPQPQDLVPGSVLRYAKEYGIKFKILGQLVPYNILKVNIASVIDKMYESDLQDEDKKYVANLVYGLAARRNNKTAFGQLFQEKEESRAYGNGQIIVDLAPDLHLVVDQVTRELSEGYRPVAALILNEMKIFLHKIVSALGSNAVGVRTDCVYTDLTKEEAKQRLSGQGFTFGKEISNLRFVEGPPPEGKLHINEKEIGVLYPSFFQDQIRMKDEFDDNEAKRIIEETKKIKRIVEYTTVEEEVTQPLLVTCKYPGSGKSRLALHWGNKRKDMLVVCPTNVLCDSILEQGYTAITTHTLLERRPRGSEEETFTPFDVSEYDVILFEEIYFYPVFQLEWIRDFMASHPKKIFIANGDPAQNEPVDQKLFVDFDTYYDKIMRQMFPRRLDLQIPKRYSSKDREKMTRLYDELLLEREHLFFVARYLPVVPWQSLPPDAAGYPHVAFTNESVHRVNGWVQSKLRYSERQVGDIAIGKNWAKVGKHKITSNSEYLVTEITESQMTVKGQDGILRTVKTSRVNASFQETLVPNGSLYSRSDRR